MRARRPEIGFRTMPLSTTRRRILIAGISALSAGVLVGGVLVSIQVLQTIADRATEFAAQVDEVSDDIIPPGTEPLIESEQGPLEAVDETECPGDCFGKADVARVLPGDFPVESVEQWLVAESYGDYTDNSVAIELEWTRADWERQGGAPDECINAYFSRPVVVAANGTVDGPDDTVFFLGSRQSEDLYSTITATARLFESSEAAGEHLAALSEGIDRCSSYQIGDATSLWEADVTHAPALTLPDSVAATGWVEDSPYGRFYSYDLQRGNLVIRSSVFTDGTVSQAEVMAFNESYAQRLALLLPTG